MYRFALMTNALSGRIETIHTRCFDTSSLMHFTPVPLSLSPSLPSYHSTTRLKETSSDALSLTKSPSRHPQTAPYLCLKSRLARTKAEINYLFNLYHPELIYHNHHHWAQQRYNGAAADLSVSVVKSN